jgi:hypothetical protein
MFMSWQQIQRMAKFIKFSKMEMLEIPTNQSTVTFNTTFILSIIIFTILLEIAKKEL